MDGSKLLDQISKKRKVLQSACQTLKEHFVGLDAVIDRIGSNIEAWYCMPELLTRPTIVCLWGLTGNGKTDLVRRLVRALDYTDNFVELQLTNKGSSQHSYTNSLQGLLSTSNICAEEPGILLLDEIQRFRSVDEDGKDIHDYAFQDLWMLLSDGSFGSASDGKQQIMDLLMEALYWEDYYQARNANKKKKATAKATDDDEDDDDDEYGGGSDQVENRRKFKQNYYQARQLKRKLRLEEPAEEIMKWDSAKKMAMLLEKLNDKSVYRPEVYSKLLIFISGNLDEAYRMADMTDETDIDADLFHKNSQRISLLTIKRALTNRFKPEQIARFGNSHVIYPSLTRDSYEKIIQRRVVEINDGLKKAAGLHFKPDQTVFDAIYRNGVFPVQGTRPVFSTISSFYESILPVFTLKGLETGAKEISLRYENKCLIAKINGKDMKVLNEGDIDKIKTDKRDEDQIRKVAIHEAGHAIVYSALFKLVPTQVAALLASEDKNGFIGIHAIDPNRQSLTDQISVLLAGRVAEEIVFGTSYVGAGAVGDIERATSLAGSMLRQYAMGESVSKIVTTSSPNAASYNLDIRTTDTALENVLQVQKAAAHRALMDRLPLLKELADYLVKNEKMDSDYYIELFKKHDMKVEYFDAKKTVYPTYGKMYKKFQKD